MNKKIRMFIVCSVFAGIISCKNYASSKDLGNLEQNVKGEVRGFLDAKTEGLVRGLKTPGAEVSAKVRELMQADESQGQPQEQVAQGVNENSELKEEKEKLEEELKDLEESLKNKKDERRKELEWAKRKFEELKEKVNNASGQTYGDIARNQGSVGAQAWSNAKEFGLNISYSSSDSTDSNELAKKVIEDALEKIEEELKNTGKNAIEIKKE